MCYIISRHLDVLKRDRGFSRSFKGWGRNATKLSRIAMQGAELRFEYGTRASHVWVLLFGSLEHARLQPAGPQRVDLQSRQNPDVPVAQPGECVGKAEPVDIH